jgi:UDP-glucose:glycoprotein glucosyltransferase
MVSAFVDAATESAQRLAPLLSVIRDELQLPLTLVLSPKTILDGEDKFPVTSYYRFVADPNATPDGKPPAAHFTHLPTNHVLTLRMDVPEPWNVQQTFAIQDTDNLVCDVQSGCSDEDRLGVNQDVPIYLRRHLTQVEYGLDSLMFFGQCYEVTGSPPNGLQLTLAQKDIPLGASNTPEHEVVIGADGSANVVSSSSSSAPTVDGDSHYSDTLVMKNVGYWQLRANPGVWNLNLAKNSKGAEIFDMVDGTIRRGQIVLKAATAAADGTNQTATKTLVMKDFVSRGELLLVHRRPGFEKASLFYDETTDGNRALTGSSSNDEPEVINVFSLATGHLYERFLKIMILSVTKRTSTKVKFWLFENFLSPTFKASAMFMAKQIGCEVEFVTYKWPEWLRGQSEKQRIIWGYKILFLDVLFPLDVKKIIYVDADQVVRGDLKELWDMDLQGAPYGYTPFCTSRESTLGFQFWQSGFWKTHLRGKPYHISALYVVDLETFRRTLVGDQLRAIYQQLSADPNSLSNLDQDLPNYAQHQVPIFSLPQEWLWCESWCSDETKALAKTIDLCNNPLHKEPKVSMAKRVISGPLFNESWVDLDAIVERYEQEYRASLLSSSSSSSTT